VSSDITAEWYSEGGPLPVSHPVPHCTAQIHFEGVDTLVWEVTDHKDEKTYTEKFVFDSEQIDDELVIYND